MSSFSSPTPIENLLQVIAQLRHPTEGCPWDLKQTHDSLGPYLLEEAYEAIEALEFWDEGQNAMPFKDELGDVLLQVVLHSQLASEATLFDFNDVCQTLTEKLVRRHPHVFGENTVEDAEAVTRQWDAIKKTEKQQSNNTLKDTPVEESVLSNIAKSQPALSRALQTSRKAVKVGFEWPNLDSLWDCVMSEFNEFREEIQPEAFSTDSLSDLPAISPQEQSRLEEEMGDILFATVNLARQFQIDPEIALTRATAKFTRRFHEMEKLIITRASEGQSLKDAMADLDFERWDDLWREAKGILAVEAGTR